VTRGRRRPSLAFERRSLTDDGSGPDLGRRFGFTSMTNMPSRISFELARELALRDEGSPAGINRVLGLALPVMLGDMCRSIADSTVATTAGESLAMWLRT
jgi:hypothetical protein